MTSHYQGRPELAINVLRHNGATDFIEKPFPENGKTLEVTIKEALEYSGRSRPGAAVLSKPQNRKPPLKFESGKMIFYKDRVELCDVVVCKGNVLIRLVLEKLCTKRNNGKYCAYSGESLAKLINAEDANNVAGAIRDFRCRVIESLLNEANIICDKKDVILSGGPGYRFSDRIILETGIAESLEKDVQGSNEIASRRRDWIMKRIQQHGSIRMGMLVENFRCSMITAKRDLHELRNSGLIEFIGAGPSGVWRAKC
jgi:hypothetical protein